MAAKFFSARGARNQRLLLTLGANRGLRSEFAAFLMVALVASAVVAQAQPLTKDQQKCVDVLNGGLIDVDKAAGKQVATCLKNHAAGKALSKQSAAVDTVEACVAFDEKSKIQKKKDKIAKKSAKKCVGVDKTGAPRLPAYGPVSSAAVSAAGMRKARDLVHDVFGADLDAGVLTTKAASKTAAACQAAIMKALVKCQATKLKEFRKCTKAGLKGKTPPGPITSAAALRDTCLGTGANAQPDPKGKIAKKCADPAKGIHKSMLKKCVDKGEDPAILFSPCADADSLVVSLCLEARVECRVCLAINGADGTERDCDLFDDGVENESCVETCAPGTGRPSARNRAMTIFDPTGQRVVLFGGNDGSTGAPNGCFGTNSQIGDLWAWDVACGTWTEIPVANGPSARARGAAVYDVARHRMLVFGGRFRAAASGNYTLYDDVWALDLTTLTWQLLGTTGPGPSPRFGTTAVYSSTDDALVVHGGNTSANPTVLTPDAGAYVLDLDTLAWSQPVTSGGPPAARLWHAAAIDPAANHLYVYGGGDAGAFMGPFLGDLWVLDLDSAAWTELHDGTGTAPEAKLYARMVFDASSGDLNLFAGHDATAVGTQNDLWSFDPQTTQAWTERIPPEALDQAPGGFCDFPTDFTVVNPSAPERRLAYGSAFDTSTRTWHVVGGQADCGLLDDVWSLDLATTVWTEQLAATTGEVCLRGPAPGSCSSLCQ